MARRRRRRSFGLVKHSGKKMSARYYARDHAGKEQARRSMSVGVYFTRASRPTNTGRVAAAKKALVALGRSREVR